MRWSLAAQFRLVAAAALLLVLGVTGTAWWIALDYRDDIQRAYRTYLRTTVQLAEAESALWQLRYGFPQFMIGSAEERERILGEQDKWYAIVEVRLAAYHEIASDAEERRTLTSLRAAYQRYKQARPKFFELWAAGDKDEAIAWSALTTTPFGAETVRAFDTQIALQRSAAEREQAETEEEVRVVLGLVTAITIVLLGTLGVGYGYSVRLLRPIRALRAQTQRIVREQLGETLDASTSSNEVTALVESFQLMSERLLARTESLRQSRERLDFLLRATPAIIYSARPHGDYAVSFISTNVRAQLGYEPEEFLRNPAFWPSHIHPDDRERVFAGLAEIETRDVHTDEYRYHHKDGSWLWMHDNMVLIRDASGAPVELVGYWIDITERRRAEEQLAALNTELEAKVAARTEELAKALEAATLADRMKSDFMANVTHELRTPLNSVIGFAELLKDQVPGPLNAKQAQFAADILASGQRLLALVEGILEMSRLDVAGDALRREPVEIGAALEERVAAHRKAAEARAVTMRLDKAPAAGRLELDPKALRRMLDALLDNAIKFNREGGAVAVSARRAGGGYEIAVADTGIGIAREDLAKLFKPLAQLDAGLARRHGGVGLGLALARRLAKLHGGTIEVDSEAGKGSTFTLRFPVWEDS